MEINIKVNEKMIENEDKEFTHTTQQVKDMKVNGLKARKMEKEFFILHMEKNIQDNF